ncbi:MAG: hypothetical protein JJV98_02775, partial [Desulfosarcina sp.]|nr:hypothetical protein [Desulfobacterales bacterium]
MAEAPLVQTMSTRKKKKPAPAAKRRRKPARKPSARLPLLKIGVGFALLVGIVCGAGALLWPYSPPAAPSPTKGAAPTAPKPKPRPPRVARTKPRPAKPVYEIYPEKAIARRTPK